MPSTYTENADKWKSLADIDYFTHFYKSLDSFQCVVQNLLPNIKQRPRNADLSIQRRRFVTQF